jgi:hypothetical protein
LRADFDDQHQIRTPREVLNRNLYQFSNKPIVTIFYSWQSDRHPRTNKNFIEKALTLAFSELSSDEEVRIEAALDRDTLFLTGSPGIAEAVLSKVQRSDIFLADLTFVNSSSSGKRIPNPNVLIELGYAAAHLGWERIIGVMNVAHGKPEKLPFDIRHRRWPIKYNLSESASEEELEQSAKELSLDLAAAIGSIIQSHIIHRNRADTRIAFLIADELTWFHSFLDSFLHGVSSLNESDVFYGDHANAEGTSYPDQALVAGLLKVFASHSLLDVSNVAVSGKPINWMTAFALVFEVVSERYGLIVDRYGHRDNELIECAEELQRCSYDMYTILRGSAQVASLASRYRQGVPGNHIGYFEMYFLAMLKAYRVIRQSLPLYRGTSQ